MATGTTCAPRHIGQTRNVQRAIRQTRPCITLCCARVCVRECVCLSPCSLAAHAPVLLLLGCSICKTAGELYVTSMYWAIMTITSIGYGDVVPVLWSEQLVSTVVMLLGSVLWGQVIATFCGVVATFNPEGAEFRRTSEEHVPKRSSSPIQHLPPTQPPFLSVAPPHSAPTHVCSRCVCVPYHRPCAFPLWQWTI